MFFSLSNKDLLLILQGCRSRPERDIEGAGPGGQRYRQSLQYGPGSVWRAEPCSDRVDQRRPGLAGPGRRSAPRAGSALAGQPPGRSTPAVQRPENADRK